MSVSSFNPRHEPKFFWGDIRGSRESKARQTIDSGLCPLSWMFNHFYLIILEQASEFAINGASACAQVLCLCRGDTVSCGAQGDSKLRNNRTWLETTCSKYRAKIWTQRFSAWHALTARNALSIQAKQRYLSRYTPSHGTTPLRVAATPPMCQSGRSSSGFGLN